MLFFLDHQSGIFHIGPEFLTAIKAVHSLVGAAIFIHFRGSIQHGDESQVVFLAQGIVVRVMRRGDLQRAGAKFTGDVFVGNNRYFAPQHGDDDLLADVFLVTLIFGVNGHGAVAENGFRPGGGHGNEVTTAIGQYVFEVIQGAVFFRIFHFQVGNGSFQARGPVDHAQAAVDQALFVQAHKSFAHRAG